jgi:diguanylate cyclase (GGDEF)-like protein
MTEGVQSLFDAAAMANTLFGAAPAALLLWLGAALLGHARAEAYEHARALLLAIALVFAVTALWWPAHWGLAAHSGPLGAAMLLATTVALAAVVTLVSAAASGSDRWFSPRRALAAGLAWLIAAACLAIVAMSSAGSGAGWALVSLFGGGVLVAALSLLCWPWNARRCRTALRTVAALAAAAVPAITVHPIAAATWADAGLAPLAALALLGGLLHPLLQRLPARGRASARVVSVPPESNEDALTGLLTRTSFERRLEQAALECDRETSQGRAARLALMFVDLDGFKPVNDTFGHASGDGVLRAVGERLRAMRGEGLQLAARVGGDEFLLLVGGEVTQDAAALRARQIVQTLSRAYEVEGRQVGISCSIGIAFYPDGGTPAKLIARADAAMYAAKRAGGAGFSFYSPTMEDDARDRFDLLRDLRNALERKELELYYQPKIDTKTGKVTAAEALLRWQHPTRGMVPPATFMPIAERFGLIRDIGHWVVEDACRQARVWQDAGLRMRVAINLSAVQMRQEDIVERIEGALSRHKIDPSRLTCEITESVAMEDTKATQATFRELGAAGIHLSIDDFGTGYSSLAYLRKLPAEELKIDRSFVTDVEHSADARSVVHAVVQLAHALGLKVVAEGIENERQRRILSDAGCDELQGFLFAKPMTARALLLWAMDDQKQHTDGFATSLFVSTIKGALGEPLSRAALH